MIQVPAVKPGYLPFKFLLATIGLLTYGTGNHLLNQRCTYPTYVVTTSNHILNQGCTYPASEVSLMSSLNSHAPMSYPPLVY